MLEITKKVLEQYEDIKREIRDLDRLIDISRRKIRRYEHEIVSDTVSGSREDGTIGPIKVTGIGEKLLREEHERLRRRMEKQENFRRKLQQVAVDIENYIQTIPDSEIRRIARFRYLEEMEWKQVAKGMGKGYSEDSCRMKFERFLQKK